MSNMVGFSMSNVINGMQVRIVERNMGFFKRCLEESSKLLEFTVICLTSLGKSDQMEKQKKQLMILESLIYLKNKLSLKTEDIVVIGVVEINLLSSSYMYISLQEVT